MMPVFALLAALLTQTTTEPWEAQPFAADPRAVLKAAEAIAAPADANILVLFERCHYTIDADGRVTFDFYRAYRVLNAAGAKEWDTVEDDWAPWHENRPVLSARVISRDGKVHALDPKTIEETTARENDSQLHGDRRLLRAPLPGIAPGAVVEERIIDQDSAPTVAGGGTARRMWFALGVPVHHTQLIVDAPRDMSLRWIARPNAHTKPTRVESNGRVVLTFDHGAEAAIEEIEEGLPHDLPRAAYIGFSTGRSWRDVAAAYERVVDGQIAGADLSSLTTGVSGGRDAVVAELLARLHKTIRYTGIEFGDASVVPRKPAETLTRRYGDCKDQAALLVAMLRSQKIPAHVALLDAGSGLDLDADLPAFSVFNHAIVYIPGDHPIWIDPTDEFARAAELPIPDQGHYALVATASSTGLIRTPAAPATENRVVESREVVLAERGPSRISETTQFFGAFERRVRVEYADAPRKKLEETLDRYARNEYRAKKLERWSNSDAADLSHPFEIHLEVSGAGRGTASMIDAAVGIPIWWFSHELPDALRPADDEDEPAKPDAPKRKARTIDFEVDRPFVYEVRWHLVPAPGFAARTLPADETLPLGPARLTRHAVLAAGGNVDLVDRFELAKRRLSPADVASLRVATAKLFKQPMRLITFDQVGQAHLAAGRVREALKEFRRLSQLHPKEAIHHSQIARAFLSGGLGDSARAEAARAIEIEPTSAWAHITLAWILQHDSLGRQHRHGWDRASSIAEYRKAKQLDPADVALRGDLAHVLEHNQEGERYGAGSSIAEAVAEYRAIRKDLGSHQYDNDLLLALIWNERWKEARSFAAELPPSALTREAGVSATAVLEGPDAAIRKAETIADPHERQVALQGAAASLLRMRHYELCPKLFDAATIGAADSAQLRQQAELMKRVRRYDSAAQPKDATSVVKQMLAVALASNDGTDRLSGLFAHDAQSDVRSDLSKNELLKMRRRIRYETRKLGMPGPVLIDLALSLAQINASGDDRLGWRVAMMAPTNNAYFYVVREGREYRIRAASSDDIGREVLHRLASGDRAGAIQWLDWARQDLPSLGNADDPVSTRPFFKLYRKGSNPDNALLEFAAASLIVDSQRPTEAVVILERCRARGGAEAEPCTIALQAADAKLEHWTEAATLADTLAKQHPDSSTAFTMQLRALSAQGKWSELRKVAEERLRRTPDEPLAQRALATALFGLNDIAGASQRIRKTVDGGQADAVAYNLAAWLGLFSPKPEWDHYFEDARRAVEMTQRQSPGFLHTLAALYAARGQVQEARETLLAGIDLTDEQEPRDQDWYVLGRIAEQFEAFDAALSAYQKVKRPTGEPEVISTWKLAQSRIAALRK